MGDPDISGDSGFLTRIVQENKTFDILLGGMGTFNSSRQSVVPISSFCILPAIHRKSQSYDVHSAPIQLGPIRILPHGLHALSHCLLNELCPAHHLYPAECEEPVTVWLMITSSQKTKAGGS